MLLFVKIIISERTLNQITAISLLSSTPNIDFEFLHTCFSHNYSNISPSLSIAMDQVCCRFKSQLS